MRRAIEVARAVTFLAHPRSTRYHPGRKKPMTPEQKARREIDRQISACGWAVDDLKGVTPDAKARDHVVIVGCVGACEREMTESRSMKQNKSMPQDRFLRWAAFSGTGRRRPLRATIAQPSPHRVLCLSASAN